MKTISNYDAPAIQQIPVIDLFAGPGGLGEGFSRYGSDHQDIFNITLSIEKDANAHNTLQLRSFFRSFDHEKIPEEYYQFLRGEISLEELYKKYPSEAELAKNHAWYAELGKIDASEIDNRLRTAIGGTDKWVLIGGPPCQAYSTAGRSRNKGNKDYIPENDARHFLYREYLRIISNHWPAVFIMENVRGILSSKVNGNLIFSKILEDLQNPSAVFNGDLDKKKYRYKIYSLIKSPDFVENNGTPGYNNLRDYTIPCEEYGIPQARHRVILVGLREDIPCEISPILKKSATITIKKVIKKLPRLRSGFSTGEDTCQRWLDWLIDAQDQQWMEDLINDPLLIEVAEQIMATVEKLRVPREKRGGEFVPFTPGTDYLPEWYLDPRIQGVCNSSTRGHMDKDLYRYLFAACFTKAIRRSPALSEFPTELLPQHKSATNPKRHGDFADRFRVQGSWRPATTIMSHISKDGHYYIHYDPTQCRSLTVREAARIQTFPDNYFFCGPRTKQYTQVGNAVPPYLAYQIAEAVHAMFSGNNKLDGHSCMGPTGRNTASG